jgi:acetylornithine deacetylase
MHERKMIKEGDVALLFVVGEEAGGVGMKAANKLGLSWESVIFGEPTELKLAKGHKGGLRFTARARGKAGHSGYPETGSNAIDSLVRGLSALQRADLPWSNYFGNTTINIGTIEGGVAANVIPASASAIGSVRIAAGTASDMKDLIVQVVEGGDPHLVVEFSTYAVDPVPLDYDVAGEFKLRHERLLLKLEQASRPSWSATVPIFHLSEVAIRSISMGQARFWRHILPMSI